MRRLVLGTAGHIDHGKTALVRALTGVDTDRLPEEKRRGITIDLGFAELPLPDGPTLSVVDVPGHEAFVRNMVAGASGIDMALLVVAADEGVMPQTREHLAIVDLLGVHRGVVALTKSDLAEDEWLELVREDVRGLLDATALADAPIVSVSSRTGAGLPELTDALRSCAANVPLRRDTDLFRMPVDRAFTVHGTGTVITGTIWSGSLRRDGHVTLLPAGIPARVRGMQQHGTETGGVVAGARAAVALAGIERQAVDRGETAVTGDAWTAAGILTVDMRVLADAGAPVRARQRVRVHIGTVEVPGRIGMLAAEIAPGDAAFVQVRLEKPVVARTGDRLVVRSWSPVHTIAGGVVLEPAARKRRRLMPDAAAALGALRHSLETGDAAKRVTAAVTLADAEGLPQRTLPVRTGLPPREASEAQKALIEAGALAVAGDRLVLGDRMDAVESILGAAVDTFHAAHPRLNGVPQETLRTALPPGDRWLLDAALARRIAAGTLELRGNAVAAAGHTIQLGADGEAALRRLADTYDAAALEPPAPAELPPELRSRPDLLFLLGLLEADGRLLRLGPDRWISARAVLDAAALLRTQLSSGTTVDVAQLKDLLKLTRKHLIPLLEHFDRTGVTRRNGDSRVLL